MKIHSIRITNFRTLEHLELKDLPETGVFVISGDNEHGKSTVLEAIYLALTTPHHSKKKEVKSTQPVGKDVGPEVSVEATVGPHRLRITKQWVRGSRSELTVFTPNTESYTGREADEKLTRILDNNVDMALLETVFMRQGHIEPALAAAGIPSLAAALEDSSGGVREDIQGQSQLMDAAEAEYSRYFQKSGREKGELTQARTEDQEAHDELEEARQACTQLEEYVSKVARAQETQRVSTAQIPTAQANVEQLRAQKEQADRAAEEIAQAKAKVTAARDAHQRAQGDLEARAQLAAQVERRRADHATLQDKQKQADEAAQAESARATECAALVDAARRRLDEATEANTQAQAAQRIAERSRQLADLEARLEALTQIEEELRAARNERPATAISAEEVDQLDQAVQDSRVAAALAAASTAKMLLRGPQASTVTVDGQPVELDAQVDLRDGMTLEIGEVTATYQAGGTGTDGVHAQAEQAQRRVTHLCAELGVADLEDARARRSAQDQAEKHVEQASRRREAILNGADADDWRAQAESWRRELDEAQRHGVAAVDPEQAELTRLETQGAVQDAQEALQQAQAAADPWLERTAATECARMNVRVEAAQEEVDRAVEALAAAQAHRATEELEAALHDAHQKLTDAQDALEGITARQGDQDPEQAAEMVEVAQGQLDGLRERAQGAREQILELQGRIEQAQGAQERWEKARVRAQSAQRHRESVEQRAHAARSLVEALQRARDAARTRYAQPFAQELTRLAAPVFGADVSFELDDNLDVVARTLGHTSVPVSQLSGGAKEQLMILARMAAAGLAGGEDGLPVPVFIDDALGHSDYARLQKMGLVLKKMGLTGQVFVLTCEPQRYDAVPGRHEFPMEELTRT
ncbi:AAA family ATPase [Corynebacterium uberis]|uniref:AAA family ATPase n=1 Tax=Corynebacterium TaxID=1716 RepID=UPI001D09B99B|nr:MULTISPECIES: AAA family ATPase [Corynebacterium]MCZ9308997.1 AAA family ATPase [Corynebacterium sp. c6VSa_13]UDL74535.1 AAA family ATPase [Corynebacterium uberis]UDL76631.1 AAA family ATPase [Corynebacterium uberis]UDL78844.1 AAA family ATPase [Corynebacterium uberis]UDL81122.1 AAA family ATPase [Corynebacterium uberis]